MSKPDDRKIIPQPLTHRLKILKRAYQRDVARINNSRLNYFIYIYHLIKTDNYQQTVVAKLAGYSDPRVGRIIKAIEKKLKGGEVK